MPLGAWDINGFPTTWWDVNGNVAGWWDKDAIPFPHAVFGDESPPVFAARIAAPKPPSYLAPVEEVLSFAYDEAPVFQLTIHPQQPTVYVGSEALAETISLVLDEGPPLIVLRALSPNSQYPVVDSLEWVPKPVPPTPPTPPRPPRRPPPKLSGGNAVFLPADSIYVPPSWLPQFLLPDECKEEEEECSDFALMYPIATPKGAVVKALTSGVVETTIDAKGRTSIVLTSDDGTRYWYADVGATLVTDGTRVSVGQTIARTKPGAPSVPEITTVTRRPQLLAAGATAESKETEPKKLKPAQVVFVDPPPEIETRVIEPPPPLPPKRFVRLVPIEEFSPPTPSRTPTRSTISTIVSAIAPVAVFAALIYVFSSFDSKPPPPPSRSKPKPKKLGSKPKPKPRSKPKKRR